MKTETIIELVRAQFPEGYKGTACELGAADGEFLSNTLELEEDGWTCLCIEANPFYAEDLFANRKKALICGVGTSIGLFDFYQYEEIREAAMDNVRWAAASGLKPKADWFPARPPFKVPVMPLCRILKAYNMEKLDFLSLDVEGREMDVISSLGNIRPKCMVVEIVDDKQGLVDDIMTCGGYHLIDRTDQDAFYVHAPC